MCTLSKADFLAHFQQIPSIRLKSEREFQLEIKAAKECLVNVEEDWKKRIDVLKRVQSLVSGAERSRDVVVHLSQLNYALPGAVRDLRSQIVKEASITASFILLKYGVEMSTLAEDVLMAAMSQVPVSTKIMSSSAAVLTEFVVENVQTRQIFNILMTFSTSKDKIQRRRLASLMGVVLTTWNEKMRNLVMRQICEMIRLAIADADPETRQNGRKCFQMLGEVEADELFRDLDRAQMKLLRPDEAMTISMSRSVSVSSVKSESTPVRLQRKPDAMSTSTISISSTPKPPPTLQEILKMCQSTSSNKKTGINLLDAYLVQNDLSRIEVNNVGSCLNRLLNDIFNPIVFDILTFFMIKYHESLTEWLKITLVNIFVRKVSADSRSLRNLNSTIEVIIETFDGNIQLFTICEMIYEPIRPMLPKVRVVLLCYFNDLVTSRGESLDLNSSHVMRAVQKLSEWMKTSPDLEKHVKRIFIILEEEGDPDPLEQLVGDIIVKPTESLSQCLDLICEGHFEPSDNVYAKLLLNIFRTIEQRTSSEGDQLLAVRVLTKLCTVQASRLFYSAEVVVCKVLDFATTHKETNNEVVDECLKVLATHLPRQKVLNIIKILLKNRADVARMNAVIRMISKMVEDVRIDEVTQIMDGIMASVVRAYGSKSSLIRRNVIFCVVVMVNRTGEDVMREYVEKLPKSMQTLIQIYVNRSLSTSLSSCAPSK